MTSIIKVDQIQTASGSTPTAADLGLNVTGSVLQVVQSTATIALSTTSTTAVDMGFSASITPSSATSKVLVSFFGRLYISQSSTEMGVYIYRNNSVNVQGGYTAFNGSGGDRIATPHYTSILDSPASSSAVTYNLYMRAGGGTAHINPNNGYDGIYGFILQEIAG